MSDFMDIHTMPADAGVNDGSNGMLLPGGGDLAQLHLNGGGQNGLGPGGDGNGVPWGGA